MVSSVDVDGVGGADCSGNKNWSMVYGLWSLVSGLWSMVSGLWSMVYSQAIIETYISDLLV